MIALIIHLGILTKNNYVYDVFDIRNWKTFYSCKMDDKNKVILGSILLNWPRKKSNSQKEKELFHLHEQQQLILRCPLGEDMLHQIGEMRRTPLCVNQKIMNVYIYEIHLYGMCVCVCV